MNLPPLPGRVSLLTLSGGCARSSLATGYVLAAPPGQESSLERCNSVALLLVLDRRSVRRRSARVRPHPFFAACDPFQPPDLLDVRHEHFVLRNAGRLRSDRVGIDAKQSKLIAADRIGTGETGHQIARLGLHRFPEDRLLLERTDVFDRLTYGGR